MNLAMALYAFLDDSGSEPSKPWYVLGGFVAPTEYWPMVANAWGLVLEADPYIEYFKASEVWDFKKGPFKDLSREQRISKVDGLVGVVDGFNMVAVSARLKWDDWRQFKNDRQLQRVADDPYFFLLYALTVPLVRLSYEHGRTDETMLVLDKHGDVGRRVCGWYEQFYEMLDDRSRGYLHPKIHPVDEKDIVPVQVADLFAWHHRRHIAGELDEWQHRKWLLLSKQMRSIILEPGNLVSLAQELGVIDNHD